MILKTQWNGGDILITDTLHSGTNFRSECDALCTIMAYTQLKRTPEFFIGPPHLICPSLIWFFSWCFTGIHLMNSALVEFDEH